MNQLLVWCLATLLLAGCAAQKESTSAASNSVTAVSQSTAKVIDVRTPGEYQGGHLRGAVNVPLNEIETRIASTVPDKATPLMVHCQSGGRSARAKAALEKMGYTNVRDLGSFANAKAVVEGGQ